MDINKLNTQFKLNDTYKIQIDDPITGEPIPGLVVEVYGRDSNKFKKLESAMAQEIAIAKKKHSMSDMQRFATEILAGCIESWTVTEAEKALKCDQATVLGVFKKHPWLRDQIELAQANRANFFVR